MDNPLHVVRNLFTGAVNVTTPAMKFALGILQGTPQMSSDRRAANADEIQKVLDAIEKNVDPLDTEAILVMVVKHERVVTKPGARSVTTLCAGPINSCKGLAGIAFARLSEIQQKEDKAGLILPGGVGG